MTPVKTLLTIFALVQPLFALFIHSKDGTRLWAEAKGDPAKPSVVWIHGYLSSSLVFNKLFEGEDYSNNLYMVRYDLRGFGQSDKPLDASFYQSEKFAEDFDAVVQVFGLVKPFAAGWSYGGSILTDIYTLHGNDAISGFISLAGTPTIALASNFTMLPLAGIIPNVVQDTNVTLYSATAIEFAGNLIHDPALLSFETKAMWVGLVAFMPQEVKVNTISRVQDPTRLYNEGGPSLPLLYVAALKDKSINGTAMAEFLRPKFKKLEVLTCPNSGHLPFLEDYETVKERVLSFVRGVVATTGDHGHQTFFTSRFARGADHCHEKRCFL